MKVAVDADRCQGHARCWELCPEVFDLDDEGHATVLVAAVPPELEDKARLAAKNCPERAISLDG
jgi:ferredoxin